MEIDGAAFHASSLKILEATTRIELVYTVLQIDGSCIDLCTCVPFRMI